MAAKKYILKGSRLAKPKRDAHRELMKSNATPPLAEGVKAMTEAALKIKSTNETYKEKIDETKRLLASLTIGEENLTLEMLRELYNLPRNWGYIQSDDKKA